MSEHFDAYDPGAWRAGQIAARELTYDIQEREQRHQLAKYDCCGCVIVDDTEDRGRHLGWHTFIESLAAGQRP